MELIRTKLNSKQMVINLLSILTIFLFVFALGYNASMQRRISRIQMPIYDVIEYEPTIIIEPRPKEVTIFEVEENDHAITFTNDPLEGKDLYISYTYDICEKYNYDFYPDLPLLIQAIIEIESNYIPTARSSANCIGLMQTSEYWQADRAARLGVTDMWDPYGNILVGTDFLQDLYFNYANKDMILSLMMYNMDFSDARKIRKAGSQTLYVTNVFQIYERLKGG